MRKEDTYEFQTDRLRKLVAERAAGKIISFDDAHPITVRFRIVDPATGIELVNADREWMPSELADKSPNQLWALIKQLSAGRL